MESLSFIPDFYDRFIVFMLIFARVSTMLTTLVFFRKLIFSTRVIAAFSAIISIYILINDPTKQLSNDLYSLNTVISILYQVLIGLMTAIVVNLILEVFLFMGQIISTQIGLNIISVLDPGIGVVTGLSQFYMNTAIFIFLMMNGHLFVIKTIAESFNYLPVYHFFSPNNLFHNILSYSGIIFSGSLLISMTVIITMILTNLSLAVMTKFAPQFNIFSIGIILLLLIGMVTVYLNFSYFVDDATSLVKDGLAFLSNILLSLR